jgi:hypothetical protein
MKIICEGRRHKGAGNPCTDSSVKVENSTKVREANLTKSSDGTQNTLKSTRQDQQLSCIAEKKCARCGLAFIVTSAGKYVMQDQRIYHWGKLEKAVVPRTLQPNKVVAVTTSRVYSCCGRNSSAVGCTAGKLHVWNGVEPGVNGPLEGYV